MFAPTTRRFDFVPSINSAVAGLSDSRCCLQGSFARPLVCMVACSSCLPTRMLLLRLVARCYRTSPCAAAIVAAMGCCCYGTHAPAVVSASLPAHAGTAVPMGPPLLAPTSRACSWNTCSMKHLLQHTSETDETFRTYSCNICVWSLQHMQHTDKTLVS